MNSQCDFDQGIGRILVVRLGRCSRISSVNRVFHPASVGTSPVCVCDGKREFVRVDLRGRTDLSVGPEWAKWALDRGSGGSGFPNPYGLSDR